MTNLLRTAGLPVEDVSEELLGHFLVASTGAYWRIDSISPVSATTVVISLSWASLFMRGPCMPVDVGRAPEAAPLEGR